MMMKKKNVSLVLVAAAMVALILALHMDYGSIRKLVMVLAVALLILAIDPTISLYKKKKSENFYVDEPEERGPGHIWLSSAVSIDSVDRR